jgi:hypothetical protein
VKTLMALTAVLTLAGFAQADEKKMERKAKAALALAATKPPGFVNLAPLPREVPKDMPGKACICCDDCKCKKGDCPNKCPVEPVVVPKKADPMKVPPLGYQWQKWPGEDWKLVPVAAAAVQPYCPPGGS